MDFKKYYQKVFWKKVPAKSYLKLLLAIFFMFSGIGFVADVLNHGRIPAGALLINLIYSGMVAVGYAHGAMRNWRWFPPVIVFQIGFIVFFDVNLLPEAPASRHIVDGVGFLATMVLSYVFFLIFISGEGIKQVRLTTEIELAGQMHAVLVPECRYRDSRLDIYGRSLPTVEVGGDLADIYESGGTLTCCVADVSGHGVAAGLLMGMFKSALRSNLAAGMPLANAINETNKTLYHLKKKTMFLTCACLQLAGNDQVEFTITGHLPILHFQAHTGRIEELHLQQIPLTVKPEFQFRTAWQPFSPGDLFVLLTDGMTEVTNSDGRELGLEGLKPLLSAAAGSPAREIFEQMHKAVKSFGRQTDDQTMMIIKCL